MERRRSSRATRSGCSASPGCCRCRTPRSRRRRPAVRGLPPGRRGDRLGLDERRGRRERSLADLLPGRLLGHRRAARRCCPACSAATSSAPTACREPMSGSDVASMTTRATPEPGGDAYRIKGTKAWISHAGHADFYTSFVRTSDDGEQRAVLLRRAGGRGRDRVRAPERKMGLACDTVRQVVFNGTPVDADRRWATRARAWPSRWPPSTPDGSESLPPQRASRRPRSTRRPHTPGSAQQFGRPIGDFQGLAFMLADMEAAVTCARATYLHAARLRDAGRAFSNQAAVAKLVCTDAAMRVTTDAVQVLGGAGYTQDFPVERYMREAKVTQIFEGTNQIQRLVIARQLCGLKARTTLRGAPLADHRHHRRARHRRCVRPGRRDRPTARRRRRAVVIVDLPASPGRGAGRGAGRAGRFVPADVRDEAQVQAAVAARELGELRIAVTCAGVGTGGADGRQADRWRSRPSSAIDINLVGTFNVLRLAAVAMLENEPVDGDRGVIVMTAWIAAYDGQIGQAAYAASKGGVVGADPAGARDLADRHLASSPSHRAPSRRRCSRAARRRARARWRRMPYPAALGAPDEYASLVAHVVTNRCSTARSSASTAPCACRRADPPGAREPPLLTLYDEPALRPVSGDGAGRAHLTTRRCCRSSPRSGLVQPVTGRFALSASGSGRRSAGRSACWSPSGRSSTRGAVAVAVSSRSRDESAGSRRSGRRRGRRARRGAVAVGPSRSASPSRRRRVGRLRAPGRSQRRPGRCRPPPGSIGRRRPCRGPRS